MTQNDFIDKIHKRLSIVSVGASALRNQGASGIVDIARDYFYQSISLDDYIEKLSSPDRFAKFLDDHTQKLLKVFPADGKSWGAARKGLNLFFREAVYNKFISDHYKLPTDLTDFNKLIRQLEVPLDFDVATGIYKDKNGTIPQWISIKKLTKEVSDIYQKEALAIADSKKIARVHLDLIYWRQRETK
jgi:hypothetical protein